MRRFVALASLLLFSIPFGASLAGCHKGTPATYCNGADSGPIVGQLTTLTLQPRLTGISLNEGEIGQVGAPTATDCKGNSASASNYSYGALGSNGQATVLLDVQTTTGRLCAGTWNRNSGGGVADFSLCSPNGLQGTAYVTATAAGVTSNPIAVYVHPIVTSIVLGPPTSDCVHNPDSSCSLDATQPNGCGAAIAPTSGVQPYSGAVCASQGTITQLAARAFQGTNPGNPANNISCLVGPLTFTAQNAAVVGIDQIGRATAIQPGSSIISANIAQASSSAGFFSTCPPASIKLALPAGQTGTTVVVNQNNPQQTIATVIDTLGNPINNLPLEYVSTTPQTIPAAAGVITPALPGGAAITAICQPPSCNPAPQNQIGLFGNGLTVTSNPIAVTTPGNNSTVLYIASTNSQYIQSVDFTNNNLGTPARLPFVPNSMVITQDLTTIYMGSATELMVYSAIGNSLTSENTAVAGTVLAVSPDNGTIVISDPVRQLIYLLASSGSISTEYGGIGTRAVWAPDSSAVYITTTDNRLLVHTSFTGWKSIDLSQSGSSTTPLDVAVTIPSVGVFLAGTPETARTNCPQSTVSGAAGAQTVANTFYPETDRTTAAVDHLTATNDGLHVLGANITNFSDVKVAIPLGACPAVPASGTSTTPTFSPTLAAYPIFTGIAPTAITGVTATSDSAFSFVSYTGTGSAVPQYNPATQTLSYVKLSGSAIAPVAQVLSTDNQTLFVGTTGDNFVHLLTRGANGFTDSAANNGGIVVPLAPQLPSVTGTGLATPNLLVQRPRKTTA